MIVWKEIIPEHGPIFIRGYLGKIKIFSIKYSMSNSNIIILDSYLPVCADNIECSSFEEAKEIAARMLNDWFDNTGIIVLKTV